MDLVDQSYISTEDSSSELEQHSHANSSALDTDPRRDPAMDIDNASDADTHESLTDSTYEIISAANTRSSDDEDSQRDDSESLLSFEDPGPQEQRQLRLHEYVSPEASRAITPAPDSTDDEDEEAAPETEAIVQSAPDLDYSEFTDATMLQTPRASTSLDPAALEAADAPTEISHTVDSPTVFMSRGTKLHRCRVSVQQTLAPSKLEAGSVFRILWHGDITDRDDVVEKIAQALAVSADTKIDSSIMRESSSKFSIVQLSSFGEPTKSPHVTLIPTGRTEVVVDTCNPCITGQAHHRRPSIMPDLEVFFHSSGFNWHHQHNDARWLCQGPFLDVRPATPEFAIESFEPYLNKAVHVTVTEGGDSPSHSAPLARPYRIPIDVRQFKQLDPELLNRNLRCLHDTTSESSKLWRHAQSVRGHWDTIVNVVSMEPFRTWIYRAVIILLAYLITASLAALAQPRQANTTTNSTKSVATVTVTSTVQSLATVDVGETLRHTADLSGLDGLQATPVVATANAVGSPLATSFTEPPGRFELLQTEKGKLYLRLPHDMAKLRRPPPIHVEVENGVQTLPATLSKWNSTVYSLDIREYDPAKLLKVVVRSGKTGVALQTLTVDPESPWHQVRILESGLIACLETTKDVARVAQKELGLFRDQASGLIVSSSEWLYEQMRNAQQSSNTAAGDLWETLSTRRDVLARQANDVSQELLHHANKHAVSISSNLARHATALMHTRQEINNVVAKHIKAARQQFGELEGNFGRINKWEHRNPLREAGRRAEILKQKAAAKIAARREARREARKARKMASQDAAVSNDGIPPANRRSKRRAAKCAKSGNAGIKACQPR